MESNERQERLAQVAAWLGVVAVHAGLFWLLTYQGRNSQEPDSGERLRLVFIEPLRPRLPVTPRPALRQARAAPATRAVVSARPLDQAASVTLPPPASMPDTSIVDWSEQARRVARDQAPVSFANDPLRSRRAQLPGGDRRGTFPMKEPVTPARVLGFIGQLFGDPGPPCPRTQARIQGLLTATSDRERELLTEELRRDREYCRP